MYTRACHASVIETVVNRIPFSSEEREASTRFAVGVITARTINLLGRGSSGTTLVRRNANIHWRPHVEPRRHPLVNLEAAWLVRLGILPWDLWRNISSLLFARELREFNVSTRDRINPSLSFLLEGIFFSFFLSFLFSKSFSKSTRICSYTMLCFIAKTVENRKKQVEKSRKISLHWNTICFSDYSYFFERKEVSHVSYTRWFNALQFQSFSELPPFCW